VTRPTRIRSRIAVALAALALAGCRNAGPAFGPTPGDARTNADNLFTALEQRFTAVERSPRFTEGRAKMFAEALVPSRLYKDTSVWNSIEPNGEHTLTVVGHFADGHYRFVDIPSAKAPIPSALGDSRHVVGLTKLNAAEFTWSTDVMSDWGTVSGADLGDVFKAVLATAAATHRESDLRANYASAFPRTTAALARMMSLDSLHVTPSADGSARVTLVTTIRPERLQPTFPAYAAYLTKYSAPARWSITVLEPDSTRWLDIAAADNRIVISLRTTADGHLAPFIGPARAMPNALIVRSSWFEKMSLFTIGMANLDAEFTRTDTPQESAWVFGLHRPPEWHLPLEAAKFMHATITRPFEGSGTIFRLAIVRDNANGGRSLFRRQITSTVKESPIMRWLGGLGGSAAGEFEGQADTEQNRFDAEVFAALHADVDALIAPTASEAKGE
jgi:hypothetical protein